MPQTNVRMSVPPWTRWVKILTIAHVVLYILWLAFGRWQAAPVLADELVLLPKSLWDGHVWQLYTYTFAQMEPQTLLFAGLALWMFGSLSMEYSPDRGSGVRSRNSRTRRE